MSNNLKLNLGSGGNPIAGFINVDKYGKPDVHHDLEQFPWPWETSSVSNIILNHVLEHLGKDVETYLGVIKEIYRISQDQADIYIAVPHPRHDDFMTDPTHVRAITPEGLKMFSKKVNEAWISGGFANTPLGIYLDVDFQLKSVDYTLDPSWMQKMKEEKLSKEQVLIAAKKFNNVVKEIRMEIKLIKPSGKLSEKPSTKVPDEPPK